MVIEPVAAPAGGRRRRQGSHTEEVSSERPARRLYPGLPVLGEQEHESQGVCRHRDERSMLSRTRNGKSQDELRDLCLLMDR